jgi:hypothetical protein
MEGIKMSNYKQDMIKILKEDLEKQMIINQKKSDTIDFIYSEWLDGLLMVEKIQKNINLLNRRKY